MVVTSLFKHYWREKVRSPMWQKNIIVNIFLGFIVLYFVLVFLGLGFFADTILASIFSGKDTVTAFNGLILHYALLEMLMRFLMQATPAMNIVPYLHLPVKRKTLIHYLLGRYIINPLNYISFLIFLPFAIKVLLPVYSFGTIICWLFAIFLLIITEIYVVLYLKRELVSTPLVSLMGALIYIGVLAADYFQIFSLMEVSSSFFNALLVNPIWILLLAALLLLVYRVNFSFLMKNAYPERLNKSDKQKQTSRFSFGFANQLGLNGRLMVLDIKLILRHKRTRPILYLTPLFVLYGLWFYTNSSLYGFLWLVFVGFFIVGLLSFSYGISTAWNGNHYDGILSRNANLEFYIKSKFYLCILFTLISFLLSIPYIYFGTRILLINFSCLLFNIGVNSYIMLFFATNNRKRVNLNSGSMMNWQGTNASQFIVMFAIMLLPVIIAAIVNAIAGESWALIILASLGITGIILNKPLLKFCTRQIVAKKYEMAAGYRET